MLRYLLTVAAAMTILLWVPRDSAAQDNAICITTSGCTQTQTSQAFVDASVAALRQSDFCKTINHILTTSYPATGEVIDARGLPAGTTSMVCAAGTSPWFNGSTYANVPSTILLPAGTITIPSTWVLPGGTKLIGEGSEIPGIPIPPTISGTTMIQACTTSITGCSTNFSGTMIEFGAGCPGTQCTGTVKGISLENVVLNGNGLSIGGIQNGEAQELTYVDHVALFQILGLGLNVTLNAQNSGPYSNITFDTGNYPPNTSTSCAQIFNVFGGTRGVHGLTCIGEQSNGNNAVLLDSSNNSLEDVRIMGFDEGIIIGSQAPAHSNVLFNIYGDTFEPPVQQVVINVIEISNNIANAVTDLSIMGVANAGAATGANTIADQVTGKTLADASIGMYALGQPKSSGYTRFTTSPNATTWVVGNPTNSSAPTGNCTTGSLYSNISGASGVNALYVCAVGNTPSWKPVK
jgi:hypothetical protein